MGRIPTSENLVYRASDKISLRDFRMELISIFLIGLEIILAVVLAILGDRQQAKAVSQEWIAFRNVQDVLSHFQETSKATAHMILALTVYAPPGPPKLAVA